MWHRANGERIAFEDIPDLMLRYFETMRQYQKPIHIVIGTDSQNFSKTKIVNVVTILTEGKGGCFYYNISEINRIEDVRLKLHTETEQSLKIADELLSLIQGSSKYDRLFLETTFSIHIDAGLSDKGKTYLLIPELVSWVKACGYEAVYKPDSYASSSVADKISK